VATEALSRPLHDADFHLWALDQAARLRANEPMDRELLAEEIGALAGASGALANPTSS
jgi:hypothetical protein